MGPGNVLDLDGADTLVARFHHVVRAKQSAILPGAVQSEQVGVERHDVRCTGTDRRIERCSLGQQAAREEAGKDYHRVAFLMRTIRLAWQRAAHSKSNPHRLSPPTPLPTVLLLSSRTQRVVLFADELLSLEMADPRFKLALAITRETPMRATDFAPTHR